MADPTGIAVAFDDDTLEPDPDWTRLDDPGGYRVVSSWSVDRGRSSELDKTATGQASIGCKDTAGILDPTRGDGPFWNKLDPMKQVAVCLRNPVTDTWHPRFRGFVSDWLFDIDTTARLNTCTLECADAFDLFAGIEMMRPHHGNTILSTTNAGDIYFAEDATLDAVQTRINKALDDAGWPSGLRTEIFTGNVGLQGTIYNRRDQLLAVLLDAADAEFPGVSNVFMAADGGVIFHGRFARFNPDNPDYNITTWYAGDGLVCAADSSRAPITGLAYRRSKDDIINAAIALPQHVDESDVPGQLVRDTTSIGKYGWRGLSFTDLLTRNGSGPTTAVEETKLFAQYYVDNYATPSTRVTQLRFRARDHRGPNGPALWALLCGVEISDIVDLETTAGRRGHFSEAFFVEGIHYTCTPGQVDPATHEERMPDLELVLDVSPISYYSVNPF